MTQQISKSIVAFGMLITSMLTTQASADTYEHIDRLAVRVERTARQAHERDSSLFDTHLSINT